MEFDLLLSLMSVVVSMLAAIATTLLAQQVQVLTRTYTREAEASRMERTLQAVQLPENVVRTMDRVLVNHYSRPNNERSLPRENYELRNEVTFALEHLETLATGILSGVYDANIAYTRLADRVLMFYEVTKLYIYESQNRSAADSYIQLTILARSWQSRARHPSFPR